MERYKVSWGAEHCVARVVAGPFASKRAAQRLCDAAALAGRYSPLVTVAEPVVMPPRVRARELRWIMPPKAVR